ncbi:hypothetical protein FKM82_013258 [Ascaphus truei]
MPLQTGQKAEAFRCEVLVGKVVKLILIYAPPKNDGRPGQIIRKVLKDGLFWLGSPALQKPKGHISRVQFHHWVAFNNSHFSVNIITGYLTVVMEPTLASTVCC